MKCLDYSKLRVMKCTFLFWVSGLSIILFMMPVRSSAQPKIVFEEEVYSFGEVMQGEEVEYTFVFRNEGNEELNIEKVSPS